MGRKIGAIMSFVALLLETCTAMLFTPFLIRSLGQSEYGVYSLVFAITSYLALLDMGMGNATVRYISKYRALGLKDEERKFLGVTTIFYTIIAILATIIGVVIVVLFDKIFATGLSSQEIELAKQLLLLTTGNIVITMVTAPYQNTMLAYEQHLVLKGTTIFSVIVRVSVGFVLLGLGYKSLSIVIVMVSMNFISRIVSVIYVLIKNKLKPCFRNIKFNQIKDILSYSIIILLQMIATQINQMADNILIGIIVPSATSVLAVYAIGAQINQYAQSFGGALNGVTMPGVVKIVENSHGTQKEQIESIQSEMTRVGRLNLMFVGLIWCVFVVCGEQFIILWAGSINREAYYVAIMLMLPQVIILTQAIGSQFLWAKNKHKIQAVLKFSIVLINVVLTILLIHWNALYGAVIGTVISLLLGDVLVMQIVFKKELGLKLFKYYYDLIKGILPSFVIAMIIGFIFKLIPLSGWVQFILNCLIMVAIYAICMLLFGLNKYEKTLLKNIKNKFIKKS